MAIVAQPQRRLLSQQSVGAKEENKSNLFQFILSSEIEDVL